MPLIQEAIMLNLIFFWIDLSYKAALTDLKVGYLKSQRRKLKKKKQTTKNLNTNTTVAGFK